MKPIPFFSLESQHEQIGRDLEKRVSAVVSGGNFILGRELEEFEKAWANYSGVPYCVGVGNGTDALTLALMAFSVGPGDEVIVPAHTFFATWLAVKRTGARIVPVDADESTFNISVELIPEAITPGTRVIVPVHMYGQSCDMTSIGRIARDRNLLIVEDNAQAQGAAWLEKRTGSYGHANATSLYPTKNLGAIGDAGAVTCFDESVARRIIRLRNYGMDAKNIFPECGINSRMDELQAAVLTFKLHYLDAWNTRRREIAAQYLAALESIGDLMLPLSAKEAYHVYHIFAIRSERRDQLKDYLQKNGVSTMIHYPLPPYRQEAFRNLALDPGQFPVAERISKTVLSLPVWPGLTDDQVTHICDLINRFFRDHL